MFLLVEWGLAHCLLTGMTVHKYREVPQKGQKLRVLPAAPQAFALGD